MAHRVWTFGPFRLDEAERRLSRAGPGPAARAQSFRPAGPAGGTLRPPGAQGRLVRAAVARRLRGGRNPGPARLGPATRAGRRRVPLADRDGTQERLSLQR